MTRLCDAVEEYVALRRALGAQFRLPAAALRRFCAFAESEGVDYVTRDLALRWAQSPPPVRACTQAERFGVVRRFAAWSSATDPRTEVLPRDLLPGRRRRGAPYVYSEHEIESLVAEAALLPSPTGLRGLTYATLFGLLAATGLRLGEALGLDSDDVDLVGGVLAVRKAKFGKSRFVPVHDTTRGALARYADARDRLRPRRSTDAFLVTEHGTRLSQEGARYYFARVSRLTRLRAGSANARRKGHGPRLHDLRHTLVARTLVAWYRAGLDVERELPKLSTYLGHSHVRHTYWYIEAVPELLALATDRLASRGSRVLS